MYKGKISFKSLPDIGFAMRHSGIDYSAEYGHSSKKRVEIAYINSGSVNITLYGKTITAPEGSVVVLFRHLPLMTKTKDGQSYSHDTVLAEFEDLYFELEQDDNFDFPDGFMSVPFVLMPSADTEKIGVEIRRIVSDMTHNRDAFGFVSSLSFVGILKQLSDINILQSSINVKAVNETVSKIKDYIQNNIENTITVKNVAHFIGKSPNYTGQLFRKNMKMSLTEYVNLQKMKKVSQLIKDEKISFADACTMAGLCDVSYGYRLFKKHIGITPLEFLKSDSILKDPD